MFLQKADLAEAQNYDFLKASFIRVLFVQAISTNIKKTKIVVKFFQICNKKVRVTRCFKSKLN